MHRTRTGSTPARVASHGVSPRAARAAAASLRALLLFLGWAPTFAAASPGAPVPDDLAPGTFHEAATCGDCHEAIHAMWSRSMHSAAFNDPIFQAAYLRSYWETGGEAKRLCLRCHAPVAWETGDLDLRDAVSREGVTCDFCHSVSAVDLEDHNRRFVAVPDGTKHGPLQDADTTDHGVAYSKLHTSAEFCAGCHEYTNEKGVPVLSTYSEWRTSPQSREGKTCQGCHMPVQDPEESHPGLAATRDTVNLHNISGGHSSDQVRKAAQASLVELRRSKPDTAVITVEVSNTGSAHYIPTGMPTRRLLLEVIVYANGRRYRTFRREYRKLLLDDQNQRITQDHVAMLHASVLAEDTRLRPGETRVERFVAHVPEEAELRAEMQLRYEYTPEILSREQMSIVIAQGSRS